MPTRSSKGVKDEPDQLAALRQCQIDRELGLPWLVGSPRQIAAFAPTRRQRLGEAELLVRRLFGVARTAHNNADRAQLEAEAARDALAELRDQTDVAFWIARKDTRGELILEQWLRQKLTAATTATD